ncbi:MAG: cytochrome c oxidase assembly factor Coa1 family protein [Planctomycetota bacterium]
MITPLLLFGGLITLVLLLVFGLMQSTWAYTEALAAAQADVEVTAALGTPIEAGRFVTGNVEVNPGSGYADLVIPIFGPNGEGTLYVEAEKAAGQWYFTTLEVAVAGTDDWYDLLADP